jgi:hypothetical protein
MKYHVAHRRPFIAVIVLFTLIFLAGLPACKKSSPSSNDKANIVGNWADSIFVDATAPGPPNIHLLTVHPDTLQFTSAGGLNATYYTQSFDTTINQEVWNKSTNSGTYSFLSDTSISVNADTRNFLSFGSGTFYIRSLDTHQMTLYSPNPGGTGGYYYIYSKF